MLDPWLLEKLVCPLTRRPLRYDEAAGELVSDAAGLAYPVRDGVPVMLVEEARAACRARDGVNWTFVQEVGAPKWLWRTLRRQFDKRIRRRGSAMRLPTGGNILLDRRSSSAGEVFVTAADIDWGAEALFARFADPTADFLDVGAHIGYYSLYLAPLVRRVVAFEPDSCNHDALRANLALTTNAQHVACAVSSTTGTVLFAAEGDTAVSRVSSAGAAVPAVSLDDHVAAHDLAPALIKIDVEGHDLAVLEGARAVLARWQPLVLTEFTQGDGDNDVARLQTFMAATGYAGFTIVWRPGRGWVRGRRRTIIPFDAALATGRR